MARHLLSRCTSSESSPSLTIFGKACCIMLILLKDKITKGTSLALGQGQCTGSEKQETQKSALDASGGRQKRNTFVFCICFCI